MPVLNNIETVLENVPPPNQEVGPNYIEYLNAVYFTLQHRNCFIDLPFSIKRKKDQIL